MGFKEKLIVHFVKIEMAKARYRPVFEKIGKIFSKLEGNKTYFMIAGSALSEMVFALGFIGPEQRESLLKIFGVGAAATVADKINRGIRILRDIKTIHAENRETNYLWDATFPSDTIPKAGISGNPGQK